MAETKGDPPQPRVGVTMAAVGKLIYVFAGRDKEHEELGELYSFHTETGEWTSEVIALDTEELTWIKPQVEVKGQSSSPGARGWFAAAHFDNSMLVYGGNSENDRLDDMYLLTLVEG